MPKMVTVLRFELALQWSVSTFSVQQDLYLGCCLVNAHDIGSLIYTVQIDEASLEHAASAMGYGAVKYADLKSHRMTNYKFRYANIIFRN